MSDNLDEAHMNMTCRDIDKHLSSMGWLGKTGGSHDIYKHSNSKIAIAVPRHRGNLPPGTVRDILKKSHSVNETEEVMNLKPRKKEKIKLGVNRSKVTLNPTTTKESLLGRIKNIINETKADKVTSQFDFTKAQLDPWGVLNDPYAHSSLKDYAYHVIQLQMEDNEEFNDEDELLFEKASKKVSQMSSDELETHKNNQIEGKKWVDSNPVHHLNVVSHYHQATEDEKKAGHSWYEDAGQMTRHIAKDTGTSQHQMAGLMANYSPQTEWSRNMVTASKVARTKTPLGGPGEGVMASTHQKKAAGRILNGEHYDKVLAGDKVKAFAHLIEHGGNADPKKPRVCVDRHAYSVAAGARCTDHGFGQSGLSKPKRYAEVAQTYHDASKHLAGQGIHAEPHQIQATTWLVRQRLNKQHEESMSKAATSKTAGRAAKSLKEWSSYRKEHHPMMIGSMPGTGWAKEE